MAVSLEYDIATLVDFKLSAANQPDPPLPTRFWSGEGEFSYALPGESATTWIGTRFGEQGVMDISAVENVSSGVATRLNMSIVVGDLKDTTRHAILERDLGSIGIHLHQLYKPVDATDWIRVPAIFKGRMSGSRFVNGAWNYDIEGREHDDSRQRTAIWSHDHQKLRWKNAAETQAERDARSEDLGMEYAKDLEKRKLRWPG